MDLTGARWGLDGAEAILKLRALHCNGDFDTYWTWHLGQEQQRVHQSRYLNGAPFQEPHEVPPEEPHPDEFVLAHGKGGRVDWDVAHCAAEALVTLLWVPDLAV